MLVYKMTPDEAYKPLQTIHHLLMPYRDAGYGAATYFLTVLDCLKGFYKALQVGLFHIDTFNLEEYEYYEKVENGDFNWITDKFLAIASPKDETGGGVMGTGIPINPNPAQHANPFFQARMAKKNEPTGRLYPVTRIDNLIKYFKEHNVVTIIRLNNKLYDRKKFTDAGIEHIEMYFPDGTTPPDFILKQFLDLVESRKGSIGVFIRVYLFSRRYCCSLQGWIGPYWIVDCRVFDETLQDDCKRDDCILESCASWKCRWSSTELAREVCSLCSLSSSLMSSMQARMWKLHPSFPLTPTVSLLRPSSVHSFKRFQEHALAYPYHVMSPARPMDDDDDVEMEEAELMREHSMDQLHRPAIRATAGVKDYFRVSKSASPASRAAPAKMTEMAIPIQPRKGYAVSLISPIKEFNPLGQPTDHGPGRTTRPRFWSTRSISRLYFCSVVTRRQACLDTQPCSPIQQTGDRKEHSIQCKYAHQSSPPECEISSCIIAIVVVLLLDQK